MTIQSNPIAKIDLSLLYTDKEKYKSDLTSLNQSGNLVIQPNGTLKVTTIWQGTYDQTTDEQVGAHLKNFLEFGAERGWLEEKDKALIDSLAQKCGIVPETLCLQKSGINQFQTKKQKIEEKGKETKAEVLTFSQMILMPPQKEEVDANPTDFNNSLVSSVPLCNPLPAEQPGTETEIKQMAVEQINLQIRLISINLNCISQQILKADLQELLTLQEKVTKSKKTLETIKREVSNVTVEKLEKFCNYLLKEIEKALQSPQKKETNDKRETTNKQTASLVEKVSQFKSVIEENSKNLTAICEPLNNLKKLFHQNKSLLEEEPLYIQVFEEFNLKQIAADLYGWYLSKREEIFEEYIKPALDPQNCSSELLLQSVEPWKFIFKVAHADQERQGICQGLGCMYETLYKREFDKNTESARSYISSALYWFLKASVFDKSAVAEKINNLIDQAPIYIDNESYLTREQLEELGRDFFIENHQNSEDQQINSLVNQGNQVSLLYQVAVMSQFIDNKEISTMILFLKWVNKNEPSSKNKETLGAISELLTKMKK